MSVLPDQFPAAVMALLSRLQPIQPWAMDLHQLGKCLEVVAMLFE